MNNYDKTFVYDERPSFESYNSMNMQYPTMPIMPMYPGGMMPNNNSNSYNNLESRISTLENKVKNLENKFKNLENNLYPKAVDYSQMSSDYINSSYQNSMNII